MVSKNLHTVVIEKLVPGGLGLGRLTEGMVVLVRYVLPGERVVVREMNRKKDYVSATLEEILTPSPDRINPPCSLYGRCGGCDLQHATYNAQIRFKKEILTESLQRAAGDIFSDHAVSIQSALISPQEFGYRQRIRLQVNNKGQYGFFRTGSHVLETVSKCLLANDALNAILEQLQSNESFTELAKQCTAFELLFNPGDNDTIILLHFRRKPRPRDSLLATELANDIIGLSTILMQVEDYGLYDPLNQSFVSSPPHLAQTVFIEELQSDLILTWEAGGFSQINLAQNKKMINLVLELIKTGPLNRILDLYCGYGNFSLPVAQLAREVVGIDSQNSAIRSSKLNATLNKTHNCYFEKKQVVQGVNDLIDAGKTFDAIILDPPRQGAADIIAMLPDLGAEQIIYISCNPSTLARDLAILCPKGYELLHLTPIDMFPQTHHLESVALLKRTIPQTT
jgi:23S rRNA (uracil1939-C5)-methyltransferase